ncbi:hypothetical protein Tco_1339362 [Tanacetum coccineum]
MGGPLSPDRVFDFPIDEPHLAYDFFAPTQLHGYAGNPNNNIGWLATDDYLLRELEAMVDEQMVVPAVDEIAEQMVVLAIKEAAEPVVEPEEEQDLAVLFGDDDFEDDASDGFGEEEVWEVNEDWLMAPTTPPLVLAVPPPGVYEVGGPSTAVAEGPSFPQVPPGLPVPLCMIEDLRVIQGSDAEIAAGVTIGEIGRVGSADFYLERRDGYRIDSAGSGLAGRCATKRHADPAAADYYYRDEQQGEHADAVHFGIGETDCSLREKTTRTPVVLFVFHFDF